MGIISNVRNYIFNPKQYALEKYGDDWTLPEVQHFADTRQMPDCRVASSVGSLSARQTLQLIEDGHLEDPQRSYAENQVTTLLKISRITLRNL
jgi:hypothetical protein